MEDTNTNAKTPTHHALDNMIRSMKEGGHHEIALTVEALEQLASSEEGEGFKVRYIDEATSGAKPGLPVSGYKPTQSDENIKLVDRNKHVEERVLRILDELATNPDVDPRWLQMGRTHIEQGFMFVNRAVFQPVRVTLTEDKD